MRSLFCTKPLSGILLGILKSRYTGGIHQISNYFAASISITRFWRFTGMADKMITRDQSVQELMELRWRELTNWKRWRIVGDGWSIGWVPKRNSLIKIKVLNFFSNWNHIRWFKPRITQELNRVFMERRDTKVNRRECMSWKI